METPDRQEEASPSPDASARRLRRGEPEAVEEVRRRVKRILAHGGLGIPREERNDLEQQVVADVWQAVHRSRFDFSAGFWGFVEVVTSRRCIDWLRARREKLAISAEIASPMRGPLGDALERERAALANEVLSSLDARCRELVTLRLRDDLTYAEIAGRLGESEVALRVQLHRCIARARQLMQRIGGAGAAGRGGDSR